LEIAGKTVLITGGAGFIGSTLSELLLRLGSSVVAYDNLDDFYDGKEENVEGLLSSTHFKLVRETILNSYALERSMKGVDVVFHLAAQAGVRYCMNHPEKAHETNVTGTLRVLEAARKATVKKVIFASSSSVYGVPVKIPIDESHPLQPTNLYGATKLAGEKYCLAYARTYGIEVVCLRYFSVYGPRGRPDQVISSFASAILEGRPPEIFGDGSQSRDFTFISDVVSATALSAMRDGISGEVFNIGYGKEFTINAVAEMVGRHYGSRDPPHHLKAYSGDFPRTLCSNAKASKGLDWRPQVSFQEGLPKFLDWYSHWTSKNSQAKVLPS